MIILLHPFLNYVLCRKDKPEKKKREIREKAEKRIRDKVKELGDNDKDDDWKKVTRKDDSSKPLFDSKSEITGEVLDFLSGSSHQKNYIFRLFLKS